jgi:hypothetical protein
VVSGWFLVSVTNKRYRNHVKNAVNTCNSSKWVISCKLITCFFVSQSVLVSGGIFSFTAQRVSQLIVINRKHSEL